jgi:hypothetical protein
MAPQTGEAANIIIPDDGVISPRAILGNIPLRLLSQRSRASASTVWRGTTA